MCKLVSCVPASLLFATACSSSSYVSALSHKSLSDPTNFCYATVGSSDVDSSKPISPSKPVCLSNIRPSKPIISSNFCLINQFVHKALVPVDLFVQVMFIKDEVMLAQVN